MPPATGWQTTAVAAGRASPSPPAPTSSWPTCAPASPGEPDAGEARWIEATVAGVRLASVYVPNGREVGSPTFAAKLAFLEAMAGRAAELAAGRR